MKSKLELLNQIQTYVDENYIAPIPTIRFSKVMLKDSEEKEERVYMDDSTFESLLSLLRTDLNEFRKSPLSKTTLGELSAEQYFTIIDEFHKTWSITIFSIIDEKHLKDSEVYKRAGISKQTFSKIRKDPDYHPKRDTAIQICIGLELNLEDSNELLSRAGFGLSKSVKRDLVISFFIERKIYNIREINYALYDLGLELFK